MSDDEKIDYNPGKLTNADLYAMHVRDFTRDVSIESGYVSLSMTYDGHGVRTLVPPEVAREIAFELLAAAAECDGKRDLISSKELFGILDHAARIHHEAAVNWELRVREDLESRSATSAHRVEQLMEAANRYAAVKELRDMIASATVEKR